MQVENPRREEIECLCKLMSTIGGQLDASPKAVGYMDMYFDRMEKMTKLASLEVSTLPPFCLHIPTPFLFTCFESFSACQVLSYSIL